MSGGPRSSGVGFFCFHALGDTKQKKLTPQDRDPRLHVDRVLIIISVHSAEVRCQTKILLFGVNCRLFLDGLGRKERKGAKQTIFVLACSRLRDSRVRGDRESANMKIKRELHFRVFPTICEPGTGQLCAYEATSVPHAKHSSPVDPANLIFMSENLCPSEF